MENKRKHLEIIQVVVNRLAGNLFYLKGWTITLITALFALSSKGISSRYCLLSYFLVIMFWILDAHFLSMERRFRDLYNDVAKTDEKDINFSMDIDKYKKLAKNTLVFSMWSPSLRYFYISLLVIMVFVGYFIK